MHQKHGTKLCRLCIQRGDELMDVFVKNEGTGRSVAQIISELMHLAVSVDDKYPKFICKECHAKLMGFYRLRNTSPIHTFPNFLLFMNQCHIVRSAVDYSKRYNVATPDFQHSPVSWDHSPLSLELEELAAEEELNARRVAVDNLLESVAQILKGIRSEAKSLDEPSAITGGGSDDGQAPLECFPNDQITAACTETSRSSSDESAYVNVEDDSLSGSPVRPALRGILRNRQSLHEKEESPPKVSGRQGGTFLRQVRMKRVKFRELSSESDSEDQDIKLEDRGHASSAGRPVCEKRCGNDAARYERIKLVRGDRESEDEDSNGSSSNLESSLERHNSLPNACDTGESTAGPSNKNHFRCAVCNKEYLRLSDLGAHVKSVHIAKMLPSKSSAKKRGRGQNRKANHNNILAKLAEDVVGEEEWKRCLACGRRFTSLRDLEAHLMVPFPKAERKAKGKNGTKSRKCTHRCCSCPLKFTCLSYLIRHMQTVHNDERPFVCTECGTAFKIEKYLKNHIKLHVDQKEFECDECGKLFWSAPLLRLHKVSHSTVDTVACGDCGKKFRAMHLLKIHLKVHDKSSHIKCPHCPTKFMQKSDLKKHMVRHSGERNYKCEVCGKKFLYKRNLNSHMHLHQRLKVVI